MAIILVVGTPAAWLLATRSFRGKAVAVTLIELPLVLPPAVAGIGLLAAVGPYGFLGGTLSAAGIQLCLRPRASWWRSRSSPRPSTCARRGGVRGRGPHLLDASRTLGVSEARGSRACDPGRDARPGRGGRARARPRLGEFGATLMFAGSFRESRRPRRWPSTTCSRPTSPPRSPCRPCWSPSRPHPALGEARPRREVLGGAPR